MGSCYSKKKTAPDCERIIGDAAVDFANALKTDDENAVRQVLVRRAQEHKVSAVALAYTNAKGTRTSAFFGDSVDENALFQAASTSKAVAAATILTLAEQRGISIDEDIRNYVTSLDISRDIKGGDDPITLRQLFSHTAGATIHGFEGYPRARKKKDLPNTKEIIIGFPRARKTNSCPVELTGKKGIYSYSGGGYMIAQLFAEDISGKSFDELAQELILGPLEMAKSCFTQPLIIHRTDPSHRHIVPAKQTLLRRLFHLPPTWHSFPELAPAGLWTTPTDYAIFVGALLDAYHHDPQIDEKKSIQSTFTGRTISKTVAQAMMTPVAEDYGLGLGLSYIKEDTDKDKQLFSIHHGGSNSPGYRCGFEGFCDHSHIVVMTNSPTGDALYQEALDGAFLLARGNKTPQHRNCHC